MAGIFYHFPPKISECKFHWKHWYIHMQMVYVFVSWDCSDSMQAPIHVNNKTLPWLVRCIITWPTWDASNCKPPWFRKSRAKYLFPSYYVGPARQRYSPVGFYSPPAARHSTDTLYSESQVYAGEIVNQRHLKAICYVVSCTSPSVCIQPAPGHIHGPVRPASRLPRTSHHPTLAAVGS